MSSSTPTRRRASPASGPSRSCEPAGRMSPCGWPSRAGPRRTWRPTGPGPESSLRFFSGTGSVLAKERPGKRADTRRGIRSRCERGAAQSQSPRPPSCRRPRPRPARPRSSRRRSARCCGGRRGGTSHASPPSRHLCACRGTPRPRLDSARHPEFISELCRRRSGTFMEVAPLAVSGKRKRLRRCAREPYRARLSRARVSGNLSGFPCFGSRRPPPPPCAPPLGGSRARGGRGPAPRPRRRQREGPRALEAPH